MRGMSVKWLYLAARFAAQVGQDAGCRRRRHVADDLQLADLFLGPTDLVLGCR